MLRSERLEPVFDIATSHERRAAQAFGAAAERLQEAEKKLAELERYAIEYRAALHARTAGGIDAPQLRAFQGFIAKLGDAISQQGSLVERARDDCALLRERWLEASRRTRAVGKVIEHAGNAERRAFERREQNDNDERAQRAFAAAAVAQRENRAANPGEEP
jgi:flagellar FliJ protein